MNQAPVAHLRTEPRPFVVHAAVDALIAFVATVFLLWLFGVPLWAMIAVAWILGLVAAPFTRRWEQRQLDERRNAADLPTRPMTVTPDADPDSDSRTIDPDSGGTT